MRFGSTAKVLLKCKLEYYRISECCTRCETSNMPYEVLGRALLRLEGQSSATAVALLLNLAAAGQILLAIVFCCSWFGQRAKQGSEDPC